MTSELGDVLLGLSLGEIIAGLGVLAGLGALVAKIWKIARRTSHFLDDWVGEPERPGQPARPGVMERLQTLETLRNNGGSSVKDAIDRIETKVNSLDERLETHVSQANEVHLQGRIAEQEMWKAIEAMNAAAHDQGASAEKARGGGSVEGPYIKGRSVEGGPGEGGTGEQVQ